MKEERKATQSELKQNIQGTNSEGKETETQIKNLEQKEEINIQLKQNEKIRIQKNENRFSNLWDNFKYSNIWIIGVPEEKRKSRNWKLIWTNNEGKLPQSGEGNKLPGSPGSPESPKEIGPKEEHTKAHHHQLPKIKDKERILKAAREKVTVTYKGVPITCLLYTSDAADDWLVV